MPSTSKIENFAPAKVNLFLHLTGRKASGYHTLDSLVSFVDVGDVIIIEEAPSFSFTVTGDFASSLSVSETASTGFNDHDNLVVRAARFLSDVAGKPLTVSITLEKNLPVAAGIGGGSSDAAAAVWGLVQYWGLASDAAYIKPLLERLGADVPVCYDCVPRFMRGIGDVLLPPLDLPNIPILLINPNVACSTQDVFLHHRGQFKDDVDIPPSFEDAADLIRFLKACENDLYDAAVQCAPLIENVMTALRTQDDVLFAQMSGSGATCFALFDHMAQCRAAEKAIANANPDWWVRSGTLNSPERY